MKPLNPLFFKIIRYYSPKTNAKQGFVLPMMIGLGLIMTVVGLTMIGRSSDDQQTVTLQNQTAQSLAVAETGITRTLVNLQNSGYLELDYDPKNLLEKEDKGEEGKINKWETFTPPCGSITLEEDLDSGGRYEVIAYGLNDNLNPPQGTLIIEGTQRNAFSRIQVQVDIQNDNNTFPGLYANDNINLGNNDVIVSDGGTGKAANVICKNCEVPEENCSDGKLTQEGKEKAISKGEQSQIDGDIYINKIDLPDTPTPPTAAIDIGDLSKGDVLPRPEEDTKDSDHFVDGAYHYEVNDITISGKDNITINTTSDAEPNGAPVYLYVDGDITMNGKGSFENRNTAEGENNGSPPNPASFRIYGTGSKQDFTINGNGTATSTFVYAPNATVGVNGGPEDPNFRGAVWAKEWNGSSGNNVNIAVPDDIGDLLGPEFNVGLPRTSSPTNWQRQPVQNDDSGES